MANEPRATREHLVARTLRRAVLVVLLFGSLGTLAELLLIGHYEDTWQFAPLGLLALVIVVIGAYLKRPASRFAEWSPP